LLWCTRIAIETACVLARFRRLRWEHVHNTTSTCPIQRTTPHATCRWTSAALSVVHAMRKALPRRLDGYILVTRTARTSGPGIYEGCIKPSVSDAPKSGNFRHVPRSAACGNDSPCLHLPDNVLELSATTGHKTLISEEYYHPDPTEREPNSESANVSAQSDFA